MVAEGGPKSLFKLYFSLCLTSISVAQRLHSSTVFGLAFCPWISVTPGSLVPRLIEWKNFERKKHHWNCSNKWKLVTVYRLNRWSERVPGSSTDREHLLSPCLKLSKYRCHMPALYLVVLTFEDTFADDPETKWSDQWIQWSQRNEYWKIILFGREIVEFRGTPGQL